MKIHLLRFLVIITFITVVSCNSNKEKLFTIRTGDKLGIDFKNTIVTNDTFNALSFEYIYNGGGVGVGDFNNDGLEDIFFGGNQVSSELYVNEGSLQFKKVTKEAGVITTRWITGVSVVDINQDGWQDIYLSVGGEVSAEDRRNILFLNQGVKGNIPSFKEVSKAFGLDDDSYSTMSAFFDYDKDGDLDMYLVNNWLEKFNRNNLRNKRIEGEAESTDRLYRNNGNNTFTNVSREAGILIEGYGLGINICDINEDTWPDVYVSNDFMSNDLLWINQKDGTFKNMIGLFLKHQTHNGMGIDVADFNNDALADIVVVDMLPPGHERQKIMTAGQNYDHFHMSEKLGYEPQYIRNTLQLNRGKTDDGRVLFSEIAFMSGVASTDWSWAPLFADFDNDGWKDLFIANGYRKDVTNLDFIFFGMDNSPFGTPEARQKKINKEFDRVPEVKITNYIYRNNGSLIFEDKTKDWGVELATFSNGASYSDLDNDGDLDLITNNIDQEVIIYENNANQRENKNHYLRLHCLDKGSYNQKVWLYAQGKVQYQERTPFRGFQSTVTDDLHFGLGDVTRIDSIKIAWPDSTQAIYHNVSVDTTINFGKIDARNYYKPSIPLAGIAFEKVDGLNYIHQERSSSDIKTTRTLLHELSRFGPCLAKGDINGDKLDDFFVGGELGTGSRLFVQQPDGTFQATLISNDSLREDGDALFFDADNDGDTDLYTASACPSIMEEPLEHRIYFNDGKGVFSAPTKLPDVKTSASCVVAADYDADGDLDLFVGGRLKPRAYPLPARSYVLQNNKGTFTDITAQLNKDLVEPGLVSSALWTDVNNDKRPDLVLAGEWMPIRIFINQGEKFTEETNGFGLEYSHGWWNCLEAADVNNDGFVDIIAGNTGKNSFFQPTREEPIEIIAKDFDKNESVDPIITYYNPVEEDRFILHNRLVLIDQIPGIKRRFETFSLYAQTPFNKVFSKEELEGSFKGKAYTLTSAMLINKQGKSFTTVPLPEIAQISTINDIEVDDINKDGYKDIVLIGNNYAQETLFGRYNASVGTILLGTKEFKFEELPPHKSKLIADGDARFVEVLNTPLGKMYVIANNNSKLQLYKLKYPSFPLP